MPNILYLKFELLVLVVLFSWLPSATLVAASAELEAPARPFPLEACIRFWKVSTGDESFAESRAKRALPTLVNAHRNIWLQRAALLPEQRLGITASEAEASLKRLDNESWIRTNSTHLRNETYLVQLQGVRAIVKYRAARTNDADGRVTTVTNNPRYEVIAYALDRYLETNVTAPAVMLNSDAAAILYIPGSETQLSAEQRRPDNLMDLSHIALLDTLLVSNDRAFPGNLRDFEVGGVAKLFGPDFDMARAYTRPFSHGRVRDDFINGVILEPQYRIANYGPLPGVFRRRVVGRLEAYNDAILAQILAPYGLTPTENEIGNVRSGVAFMLASIRSWQQRYGSDVIVID